MRKFLMGISIIVGLLVMTACEPITVGLTAVDVGAKIYRAVKEAKASHPDEFTERANFYAELYCEFRDDDYPLEWEKVRVAAINKGAPVWAVDTVKEFVDKRCGDAEG